MPNSAKFYLFDLGEKYEWVKLGLVPCNLPCSSARKMLYKY